MRSQRRAHRFFAVFLSAAFLASCTSSGTPVDAPPDESPSNSPATTDSDIAPLVNAVHQSSVSNLIAPRLAEGLIPPTNRWYSGLVFGDDPQPVFPRPLAFALTETGFSIGLPKVTSSSDTIYGSFIADFTVDAGATGGVVVSDDPSVVVLELSGSGGRVTLAQGVPFVTFYADDAAELDLPASLTASGDEMATVTISDKQYAVAWQGGQLSGTRLTLDPGGVAAFWAVPDGEAADELRAAALERVTESRLEYEVDESTVTTRLRYETASGGTTAVARMPHQTGGECDAGSYASAYGPLRVCVSNEISWQTARTSAVPALDLSNVGGEQRETLAAQLATDAATLGDFPADTYFGGKRLQRAAMLLMVAEQLGETQTAESLADELNTQLSLWTEPEGCASRQEFCFTYDPVIRGMVGLAPAFGSEDFNDHNFHWGHFLMAASILAQYRPETADQFAPVLDLLAADIAGPGGEYFPRMRSFDPYASHSWASGSSPFADGNNQESVSESINAWAAVELWARVRGDEQLTERAAWMLSLEAAASDWYWLEPDLEDPEFAAYEHGIVSLNWGGKRDYATWFSPEPAAKLGILLLPAGPSSVTYLAGEQIEVNVEEALGGTQPEDFALPFGDYILMYWALAEQSDHQEVWQTALDLPEELIDDGLSRTYLLAWLAATQ